MDDSSSGLLLGISSLCKRWLVVGQMVLWIYLWIYFLNKFIVNRVPEPLLNFGYCEHLNPCQMAQPRANWTVPERRLPCRLGCYPIQPENYNKITKVSDIHQIGEEHCSWSSIFVSVSRLDDFFACHIWRGRVLFNWTKWRTEELWPIKRGRFLHEWAKQGCKKNWVKGQRIYRAQSKYYSW